MKVNCECGNVLEFKAVGEILDCTDCLKRWCLIHYTNKNKHAISEISPQEPISQDTQVEGYLKKIATKLDVDLEDEQ